MWKKRAWEILEINDEHDKQGKVFHYFISILISLNVIAKLAPKVVEGTKRLKKWVESN